MTTITNTRAIEIARKFAAYEPGSKIVTIRGDAIVEYARALLAEHEGKRVAELLQVRAALEGSAPTYTHPATHGSPAAPMAGESA